MKIPKMGPFFIFYCLRYCNSFQNGSTIFCTKKMTQQFSIMHFFLWSINYFMYLQREIYNLIWCIWFFGIHHQLNLVRDQLWVVTSNGSSPLKYLDSIKLTMMSLFKIVLKIYIRHDLIEYICICLLFFIT
jgi:hypothetical protein